MDEHIPFVPYLGTTNPVVPFLGTYSIDEYNVKLAQDRYEIYVNGDFVGFKPLLTQNASLEDVDSFLHEQGFKAFDAEATGDHYNIQTEAEDDKLKQALHVYLQTR